MGVNFTNWLCSWCERQTDRQTERNDLKCAHGEKSDLKCANQRFESAHSSKIRSKAKAAMQLYIYIYIHIHSCSACGPPRLIKLRCLLIEAGTKQSRVNVDLNAPVSLKSRARSSNIDKLKSVQPRPLASFLERLIGCCVYATVSTRCGT